MYVVGVLFYISICWINSSARHCLITSTIHQSIIAGILRLVPDKIFHF